MDHSWIFISTRRYSRASVTRSGPCPGLYTCLYACLYTRQYAGLHACLSTCLHACLHACLYTGADLAEATQHEDIERETEQRHHSNALRFRDPTRAQRADDRPSAVLVFFFGAWRHRGAETDPEGGNRKLSMRRILKTAFRSVGLLGVGRRHALMRL